MFSEVCENPVVGKSQCMNRKASNERYAIHKMEWPASMSHTKEINLNPTHQNISLQSKGFIMKEYVCIGFGR